MNTRVRIITAVKECSLSPIDCEQMEAYAVMEEWELRDELIGEIYALRDAYDELLLKANVDSLKLLDQIEYLKKQLNDKI